MEYSLTCLYHAKWFNHIVFSISWMSWGWARTVCKFSIGTGVFSSVMRKFSGWDKWTLNFKLRFENENWKFKWLNENFIKIQNFKDFRW